MSGLSSRQANCLELSPALSVLPFLLSLRLARPLSYFLLPGIAPVFCYEFFPGIRRSFYGRLVLIWPLAPLFPGSPPVLAGALARLPCAAASRRCPCRAMRSWPLLPWPGLVSNS